MQPLLLPLLLLSLLYHPSLSSHLHVSDVVVRTGPVPQGGFFSTLRESLGCSRASACPLPPQQLTWGDSLKRTPLALKEGLLTAAESFASSMRVIAPIALVYHLPSLPSSPTTWLKCESLKQLSDEISSRFADMLGVNSTELGSVARKSFEQMAASWKSLRKQFLADESELDNLRKQIANLQRRLDNKENEVSERFDREIARISREYQEEKERDQEKLSQAELKMDQMADTLKYLNGIFRAMQNDSATLKTSDMHSLVTRLTRENEELKKENSQLDAIKTQLFSALNKIKAAEATIRGNQEEIHRLGIQLQRREEVINHLMEKDTIRTAEIEKLQRISKMKDEEILAMDMKDVATSVLCIKCKKSLDDMTNIRSTLMMETSSNAGQRLQCENYRILLPNLRNRKPNRTTPWIRSVMRSVLLSKMKEDLSLHFLKCDTTSFPAFVYSWFKRNSDGITGTALTKLQVLCDEDRWGLYYGIKALHKEDSECALFWSLLDETFGQDGLRFLLYCLSVIMSLGGRGLWRQFGSALTHGASVNTKLEDDDKVRANIWIDIATAREGVQMILVKALAPHLSDALDSIDALKVKPDDLLPPENVLESREDDAFDKNLSKTAASLNSTVRIVPDEPTHINLFTWLRIMLQQFHADQIHRNAAIRLMFETASVGALTPAVEGGTGGKSNLGGAAAANSSHVEYPQFQSICQTLFPFMSVTEISALYARCHYAGKRRVTSDIFKYEADISGLFAHGLKLPTLPLLKQLNVQQELSVLIGKTAEESKADSNGDQLYTKKTLFVIRSKLATVIHRRFAGLLPGIKYMMKYVPEKWKTVLMEAVENTNHSLNDSYLKLKELQKIFNPAPPNTSGSNNANKEKDNSSSLNMQMEKTLFLDGVQPYLHYRKLLSLTLLIQSCTENPFLPTEIFTAVMLRNDEENIQRSVLRLERILENMESCIFAPADMDVVNIPKRLLNKYDQFLSARHVLIVRRIQTVFRKFMSKEVPIPRAVRQVMAAGYLTNSIHQEHLLNQPQSSKFYSAPLKLREVYHEPWWAQVNIANIYLFKISYDMKAAQLGKQPISIPQAISAYFYCLWGSTDVAERMIQDLFVAIKAYRFNMPRLRLFGCFVGDGRDLEENIQELLFSSEAVSIYFSVLFAIHRQLAKKREYMLRLANQSKGTTINSKVTKAGNQYTLVETLFPSTENTFQRQDKRDVWLMDADMLTQSAKAWASQQQWLRGQVNLFSDLPEKLRPDLQNRVDVDDFLWIVMIQWAKLEAFHVKKCLARGTLIEKSVFGPSAHSNNATPKAIDSPANLSVKEGFLSRRMSVLPLYNLRSIVESIYRPEDGDGLADIQHYATSYIQTIRSRRLVLPQAFDTSSNEAANRRLKNVRNMDAKFGSELQQLLKECVLWDTNLAFVDSPANPQEQIHAKRRSLLKASFVGRTSLFNTATVSQDNPSEGGGFVPGFLAKGVSEKDSKLASVDEDNVPVEEMVTHFSAASIKLSHYADMTMIGNGAFPEYIIAMCKTVFASYQGAINAFLDKLSAEPLIASDMDVKNRLQAIRVHLLQVGEFFQVCDFQNMSFRIFNFELLGAVEDLRDSYLERSRNARLCNDAVIKLQTLFSSVSDLAVLTRQEFPRDAWQKGAKMHLERAFVYSIATKNALL